MLQLLSSCDILSITKPLHLIKESITCSKLFYTLAFVCVSK
nr:MAG TPA: hypothetical protein [Caudoviricetes sp.]